MNFASRLGARVIACLVVVLALMTTGAAAHALGDAAPEFVTSTIGPAVRGEVYTQHIVASDDDARFSLADGAPDMSISADGLFEWLPTASGSFEVVLVATTTGGMTSRSFAVTVSDPSSAVPGDASALPVAPEMQLPTLSEPHAEVHHADERPAEAASRHPVDPLMMTGGSVMLLLMLSGIMLMLRKRLAAG